MRERPTGEGAMPILYVDLACAAIPGALLTQGPHMALKLSDPRSRYLFDPTLKPPAAPMPAGASRGQRKAAAEQLRNDILRHVRRSKDVHELMALTGAGKGDVKTALNVLRSAGLVKMITVPGRQFPVWRALDLPKVGR
jgi:hypothetical protein